MGKTLSAKELRGLLPEMVRRVRRGDRFTVLYRSRPAFQIIPAEETGIGQVDLDEEPLYRAGPVGHSRDGKTSADHDAILYGES